MVRAEKEVASKEECESAIKENGSKEECEPDIVENFSFFSVRWYGLCLNEAHFDNEKLHIQSSKRNAFDSRYSDISRAVIGLAFDVRAYLTLALLSVLMAFAFTQGNEEYFWIAAFWRADGTPCIFADENYILYEQRSKEESELL